jgi:hypothetical protein
LKDRTYKVTVLPVRPLQDGAVPFDLCITFFKETIMAGKKKTKTSTKKTDAAKDTKSLATAGQPKKLSALDGAAQVLAESGQPMNCQQMIEAMAAKGYWSSPGGKTPSSTLYSAILRELKTKGADARFRKTERGKFTRA